MNKKLSGTPDIHSTHNKIDFLDLFRIDDLQQIQDLFADAHGVASIITYPDGTPITRPSNFCRLCNNIIRGTEKGREYCYKSDAVLGRQNLNGPQIQHCLSGGLWDAGASITVGGEHVANWLIGQVRNDEIDPEYMRSFAQEIGADQDEFMKALNEVPIMSTEQFRKVSEMLFVFAKELSDKAYHLVELKRKSKELEKSLELIREREDNLSITLNSIGDGVITTNADGIVLSMNPVAERLCGWKVNKAIGKPLETIFQIFNSENGQPAENPVSKVISSGEITKLGNHIFLISKTGKEYQISDSAAPIRNLEGEVLGVVLVFSDITEKYKAQEKVRRSENQFHSLYENMKEGVAFHELVTDTNGKPIDYLILDANASFEKQLNIRKIDAIGKTSRQAYGVNEPPFLEIYTKVVNTGRPVFFEVFFPPMEKHFSISAYRTSSVGFATIFVDITQQKKAEEELTENENRWRKAIANAPVPVMIHNENDQVLQISSGWTKFSGYTLNDIPTMSDWTEKAYGKRKGFEKEYIDHLFEIDKTVKNGEWTITAKNGTKRIWDFQTTPLGKDRNGKKVLQSLAVDITERKHAEELLKESEQQLQFVLKGSQLGFWDWNLETNEVKRNERWAQMLGYNLHELSFTVKQWIDFIHPEDREIAQQSINDHLSGKTKMHRLEYRMQKKDGNYIWVLDQAKAVKWDSNGQVIRMSGTHTDVTERKKAEEEIKRQNEKLQRINAEKDKFFSIIAHDLKNPFNSILGFSELLMERVKDQDINSDEIEHYATIILNSSSKVMDLLTNLMEWSRSQTGRMKLIPADFNLKNMIGDILLLFAETANQKSITIEKQIPESIMVHTDMSMISTILRNLISNAIKFTPSHGQINVSAGQNSNETWVKVSDTGVGIPESAMQKIFRIGENYSTPGTQNEEGTGLGLILCKEFVERLGGKIWVDSKLKQGSQFTFTIPSNS